MKITWLGHACFKLEQDGYVLILDPYADGSVPGLMPMHEKADKVLCSHGHRDHSGIENVELSIVKPDNASLSNTESEETIDGPFNITVIDTYHDDAEGTKRGNNKIHIMEANGMKIAHMGDLGCDLTEAQAEVLREVDIMMIPVGGFYTIDAKQAKEFIFKCRPKLVIPMHYSSNKYKFGYNVLAPVEEFAGMMENVKETGISRIDTECLESIEQREQVFILVPQNANL